MKYCLTIVVFFLAATVFSQHNNLPSASLLGRTTGILAHIEFGTGDDRLGGAKMTYLDSNVVLRVVDSLKDEYKVQLSQHRVAYIPKKNFIKDSSILMFPDYVTGSIRVYGNDTCDYVTVQLPEKLPYTSIQQINPHRLVVDIFGAASNTNWITQLSTAREIKNTYYEQTDNDIVRLFIELNHPVHWGHYIYYENKKLVIRVNRQPDTLDISKLIIAVDAGHGGTNTGAGGVTTKVAEKKLTLQYAQELEKALQQQGATVFMTRTKDTTLSMEERVTMLRQVMPHLLISIHFNSSANATTEGTSTFYRYIGFRPLTQHILKRMLETGLSEYGNVGNFNFSLSGPTEYPNCLVEVNFISNRKEEALAIDPDFRKKVAEKITQGIKDWLMSINGQ